MSVTLDHISDPSNHISDLPNEIFDRISDFISFSEIKKLAKAFLFSNLTDQARIIDFLGYKYQRRSRINDFLTFISKFDFYHSDYQIFDRLENNDDNYYLEIWDGNTKIHTLCLRLDELPDFCYFYIFQGSPFICLVERLEHEYLIEEALDIIVAREESPLYTLIVTVAEYRPELLTKIKASKDIISKTLRCTIIDYINMDICFDISNLVHLLTAKDQEEIINFIIDEDVYDYTFLGKELCRRIKKEKQKNYLLRAAKKFRRQINYLFQK